MDGGGLRNAHLVIFLRAGHDAGEMAWSKRSLVLGENPHDGSQPY